MKIHKPKTYEELVAEIKEKEEQGTKLLYEANLAYEELRSRILL